MVFLEDAIFIDDDAPADVVCRLPIMMAKKNFGVEDVAFTFPLALVHRLS